MFHIRDHGLLTKYVKLRVAHAPGMPGTFSPPPTSKEIAGMHHGTCVTHVPWCMSGSLNCSGGENVPSILRVCATRNFTYLARGPWRSISRIAAGTVVTRSPWIASRLLGVDCISMTESFQFTVYASLGFNESTSRNPLRGHSHWQLFPDYSIISWHRAIHICKM